MLADVNVRPAILADDVLDMLHKLYDVVPPSRADTTGNRNQPDPDSFDNWQSVDYSKIYENATEEERVEIERELEEIREDKRNTLQRLHDYRKCDKHELSTVEHSWLVNLLMGFVRESNWRWMFEVWGIDQMELLQYHEDDAQYDWHNDSELLGEVGKGSARKITIIVQLSDPDDYEGCDLEIREIVSELDEPRNIMVGLQRDARLKGTVIMFPSFLDHRITPLIKGSRRSLVAWATGPRWR